MARKVTEAVNSTESTVSNVKNGLTPFTGTVRMEVPLAAIYDRLLAVISPDFKHADMLAHAVVGSAKEKGTILYIYNSLTGFGNGINYEVGEVVICKSENKRMNVGGRRETVEIGLCTIAEINLYGSYKLKVEYEQDNYSGDGKEMSSSWVSLDDCSRIPVPDVIGGGVDAYEDRRVVDETDYLGNEVTGS